jgi:hypothetical protein
VRSIPSRVAMRMRRNDRGTGGKPPIFGKR